MSSDAVPDEKMQAMTMEESNKGTAKRDALRRLTQGPITTRFPASFLHLHPEVTLLVDAAAAGRTQ